MQIHTWERQISWSGGNYCSFNNCASWSKGISNSFSKFLYCLENEQWHLTFIYPLFQIHFPTDSLFHSLSHLNIISSFIHYSFFIIIYSFYIHSQQLYFSIKSIIFTTFFAILSQESHQNLIWKIVTSSNLNPLLKLYFYSPILANNNMLLKIYCENIVVEFLNYHFFFFIYYFSFLSFYHPYASFLFFLLIFLHHTCIPIYTILSLFVFSTFHFPKPPSLFLSPVLFLNFFFFFFHFLLNSNTLSNFLCNKKRRNR